MTGLVKKQYINPRVRFREEAVKKVKRPGEKEKLFFVCQAFEKVFILIIRTSGINEKNQLLSKKQSDNHLSFLPK